MGLREQKAQIKDVIVLAKETIKSIESKKTKYYNMYNSAVDLRNALLDGEIEELFDLEEFETDLITEFLSKEMEDLFTQMDDVYNEIQDFISEQSESRQEKLEERYYDLENVLELFSLSETEYTSLNDAINGIEEGINFLKQMI